MGGHKETQNPFLIQYKLSGICMKSRAAPNPKPWVMHYVEGRRSRCKPGIFVRDWYTAATSPRMIRAISAQSCRLNVSGTRMSTMLANIRSLSGIGPDGA